MRKKIFPLFFLLLFSFMLRAEGISNLHALLMNATYKIVGDNGTIGTGFILGKPLKEDSTRGIYIY